MFEKAYARLRDAFSLDCTVFDQHWKFSKVSGIGVPEINCIAYDDCQGKVFDSSPSTIQNV